jgi:heme-degrading monooxygenase HmoA
MMAVIFEVEPKPGQEDEYLGAAAELAPLLQEVDGFLSIERFRSVKDPGKLLSLSFWRDEEAVEKWRNVEAHRAVQKRGRSEIFRNYRLRIGEIVRDYGMTDRDQAPSDSAAVLR